MNKDNGYEADMGIIKLYRKALVGFVKGTIYELNTNIFVVGA